MSKLAIIGFLIAHGLVHLPVAITPPSAGSPFDPTRSWVLAAGGLTTSGMRTVGIALAASAALAFVVAGLAMLAQASWWPTATTAAAALSLVHLLVYFTPWLSLGAAIDVAVLWALSSGWLAARVG